MFICSQALCRMFKTFFLLFLFQYIIHPMCLKCWKRRSGEQREDIEQFCWANPYKTKGSDKALEIFLNIHLPVIDKHARSWQWGGINHLGLNGNLRSICSKRNYAKLSAQIHLAEDKQTCYNLIHFVTQLKLKKNYIFHHFQHLERTNVDLKLIWKTLNGMISRNIPT